MSVLAFYFSVEAGNLEGTNESSGQNTQMMMGSSGTTNRINLLGANKRMFHLLKRAKVQLIKIDQQKQLKSAQVNIFAYFYNTFHNVYQYYLDYVGLFLKIFNIGLKIFLSFQTCMTFFFLRKDILKIKHSVTTLFIECPTTR